MQETGEVVVVVGQVLPAKKKFKILKFDIKVKYLYSEINFKSMRPYTDPQSSENLGNLFQDYKT